MKLSIIQTELAWEDKPANLKHFEALIRPLYNDTDIVVLPEMFNTGFTMNPQLFWEYHNDETFKWMQHIAKKGNFGLCGSYIVKDGSDYFNRWVFVTPENETWHYDKRHLFSMAGEDKLFTKGKKRLVFSFRGIRISPYICYDLRFPVWSRNSNDYDLMIYAANWPESRREVWDVLLKARAIENQCYVAGANITGTDGAGIKYIGNSMIISPRGEVLASDNQNTGCIISGEISLGRLNEFRTKFPVLDDADDFMLLNL
jgi:predicted amidohydrolase